MRTQLPLPKKGAEHPSFSPRLLWPNGCMDQDESWHGGRPRPWPHCVRCEPRSSSPKRHSPQFSAHVYCGQMAGWIQMPLGTEVSLGPGHILLDGDAAHPPKGEQPPPIFSPCLLWKNGWMDQDATSYGGRPLPRPHCVRWGPAPLLKKGPAPNFRPMSVVAKRSPISATAGHL